jgi:hypothetical protein
MASLRRRLWLAGRWLGVVRAESDEDAGVQTEWWMLLVIGLGVIGNVFDPPFSGVLGLAWRVVLGFVGAGLWCGAAVLYLRKRRRDQG